MCLQFLVFGVNFILLCYLFVMRNMCYPQGGIILCAQYIYACLIRGLVIRNVGPRVLLNRLDRQNLIRLNFYKDASLGCLHCRYVFRMIYIAQIFYFSFISKYPTQHISYPPTHTQSYSEQERD